PRPRFGREGSGVRGSSGPARTVVFVVRCFTMDSWPNERVRAGRTTGTAMIIPQRAPVKPRVYSAEGGAAFPLEEEAQQLLQAGRLGVVAVVGPPGSGKTTALQHLAAVLPQPEEIRFLDEPSLGEISRLAQEDLNHLVLVAATPEQAAALTAAPLVATYR